MQDIARAKLGCLWLALGLACVLGLACAPAEPGPAPQRPAQRVLSEDVEALGDELYGVPVLDLEVDAGDWRGLLEDPYSRASVPCAVRFRGRRYPQAQLELHGGFAREFPKKSLRLDFGDDPLWVDLWGPWEGHREVVLLASWIDPTLLRNKLTMDRARAVGGLAPRSAHVVVALGGEFYGVYALTERIGEGWVERQGFDTTGTLYKAENHRANWAWKADPMEGYASRLGPDRPPLDLDRLLRAASQTPATQEDFARELEPLLSLQDFQRWEMVHTLAANNDTFTKNYYLYHDTSAEAGTEDARFRIISWDADATWGMKWDGTPLASEQVAWHGTDRLSPRLFSVAAYKADHLARYEEALAEPGGLLSWATLSEVLDDDAQTIARVAPLDLEAWPRGQLGGYGAELEHLRQSLETRVEVMRRVVQEERGR